MIQLSTMSYINISGYKFTKLDALEDLQSILLNTCHALTLKGTILLSQGGINAFVCGTRQGINEFYDFLATTPLPNIAFKESLSNDIPFKFMRVRIKNEIVTMGLADVEVAKKPAPSIAPATFKEWIEQGKEMVVLDTRNDYEVQLGKFTNAMHLNGYGCPQIRAMLKLSTISEPVITKAGVSQKIMSRPQPVC